MYINSHLFILNESLKIIELIKVKKLRNNMEIIFIILFSNQSI